MKNTPTKLRSSCSSYSALAEAHNERADVKSNCDFPTSLDAAVAGCEFWRRAFVALSRQEKQRQSLEWKIKLKICRLTEIFGVSHTAECVPLHLLLQRRATLDNKRNSWGEFEPESCYHLWLRRGWMGEAALYVTQVNHLASKHSWNSALHLKRY